VLTEAFSAENASPSTATGTWTLYLPGGYEGYTELLAALGPYKGGKSCLHLKSLDSIDMAVSRTLVTTSAKHVKATNPTA